MSKQFTLNKTERLKSRKAIDELFKNGKRFSISSFRVFYLINMNAGLQFGIGVSTRNFKKAVDRNRVKRLVREAWRVKKNPLQQLLIDKKVGLNLFIIFAEKELPDFLIVNTQVEIIIKKLSSIINENSA